MEMKRKLKFPIRFKILIALLLVVTTAVSLITFTMANLFHTDKSAYVHDLTSEMAVHTAAETRALLTGYSERLQVFTRLLFEQNLQPDQKSALLKQLFEDFHEFVSITLFMRQKEVTTVYDARSLEDAGLAKADLIAHFQKNPIPFDRVNKGDVYVANATLTDKLPAFVLAVSRPLGEGSGEDAVVAAIIRLTGLQRLASRSHVFTAFITDAGGNTLAHSDIERVIQRRKVDWVSGIEEINKTRVQGSTHEYLEGAQSMVGGLARVEVGDLVAGVQIPKAAAYLTARELLDSLILVALLLLLVSAVLSLLGSRLITRPLEGLLRATRTVAQGRFDIQVEASSRDEIGDLADSFNHMAQELDSREKALKDAQAALVQSEKLAAFGQLGAGIAHEIKNPLAGILGLTQLSKRKLSQEEPIYKNLVIIEKETNRCTTIIQNLLKFARQEKVDYESVDLNQVAQDAMAIVEHQLEMNKVRLERKLADSLPVIYGNANQIQQVLINLMINAQQAMDGSSGTVTVSTAASDGQIQVVVQDNGPGIPEEIKDKIFEPFFTTKAVGKGTGLGLSVSYGIVKEHKGDILVDSRLDEGTKFTLVFPIEGGSDSVKVTCPHCRKTYQVKKEQLGLKNKCRNCRRVFTIQSGNDAQQAGSASRAA
jgi:predicted Zn finger-like uncharacterized protein